MVLDPGGSRPCRRLHVRSTPVLELLRRPLSGTSTNVLRSPPRLDNALRSTSAPSWLTGRPPLPRGSQATSRGPLCECRCRPVAVKSQEGRRRAVAVRPREVRRRPTYMSSSAAQPGELSTPSSSHRADHLVAHYHCCGAAAQSYTVPTATSRTAAEKQPLKVTPCRPRRRAPRCRKAATQSHTVPTATSRTTAAVKQPLKVNVVPRTCRAQQLNPGNSPLLRPPPPSGPSPGRREAPLRPRACPLHMGTSASVVIRTVTVATRLHPA